MTQTKNKALTDCKKEMKTRNGLSIFF